MGTSGNPAKKAAAKKTVAKKTAASPQQVTSVGDWQGGGVLLTLPSGNVVKAKRAGVTELAHKGLIPNSLMSIVMEHVKKGQAPKAEDVLTDKVDLGDIFSMVDKCVLSCVVDPKVHPVPVWTESDHDEGDCTEADIGKEVPRDQREALLYLDMMDDEDKEFIFGWATGGTSDIAQFRKERAGLLASIPGQPTVAGPTK